VFKGARLTVTGQRKPGDAGAKVLLQRHTRGWHTIATTRTKRHGKFTVGAKASSLGTWKLRVATPKGKGNLANQTAPFTLIVKKRPAPPPAPVISTPTTPCTTCAGGAPDIPVNGGLTAGEHGVSPALAAAFEALRHDRQRPLPTGLAIRQLAATPPRRGALG